MRILLDECVPRDLKKALVGADCVTSQEAGFAGLKNGALLAAVEQHRFDIFLTVDRGILFQQNVRDRTFAIVTVRANSNRLEDLQPIVASHLPEILGAKAGEIVAVPRSQH
jgi:hypothetical protein